MKKINWSLLLCSILHFLLLSESGYAQNNESEKKAVDILDKAMGKAIESEDVAIYFEGISFGLKDPLQIFSLPVYQVVRGGYLFIEGKKYEMQIGGNKSLSDGKLMVVIDEVSKIMYIDSVRNSTTTLVGSDSVPDMQQMLKETFGEGFIEFIGEELVHGIKCYKIKSTFTGETNTHVYYWVNINTGKLFLMAEWQNNAYDVYWYKNVTKAPKGHTYSINLPKRELETYYGYEVIDNRFVNEQFKK